jgi:hypothetical protein
VPKTCAELDHKCGVVPDGCEGTLPCGDCEPNERCEEIPTGNRCVCVPLCDSLHVCGDDGCNGSCGTCDFPQICYEGGCYEDAQGTWECAFYCDPMVDPSCYPLGYVTECSYSGPPPPGPGRPPICYCVAP